MHERPAYGPVDLVVFDLDGTLLDHAGASAAALSAWLQPWGVTPERLPALVETWSLLEERHWDRWRRGEVSFQEQRRGRLREFLPQLGREVVEAELDDLFLGYLTEYEAAWVAYPDAVAALEAVRDSGRTVAVLTNGDQAQQCAKVRAIGLEGRCGEVFASSRLPAPKPDPRSYLAVCDAVGVAPERALMVGDNLELDVLAPRTVGLAAVHLDRADAHPVPDDSRIRSLDELRLPPY